MSTLPTHPSVVPMEFLLLVHCCSHVTDNRKARGKVHPLPSLLALCVLGLMAGQSTVLDVVRWAQCHPEAWHALGLRRCPSVATLWRLLQQVSVAEVQQLLRDFTEQLALRRPSSPTLGTMSAVALDGKTVRGVREGDQPLRLLHAYAHESALLLEALVLPSHVEEAGKAQAWVETLGARFPGLLVLTGDAAYADQSLCQAIVQAQRDYLVRVKKTNPRSSPRSRSSSRILTRPTSSLRS